MTTNDYRPTKAEVREEVVRENRTVGNGIDHSVDRHERIQVVRDANGEYREHVVEDVGTERRLILDKVAQLIYLVIGLLELGLGLRILLKLIAANPASPFAQLVYGVTDLLVWPFQGLTVTPTTSNGMVLEISTFFAMVVYAVAAWGVVKLLYLLFTPASSRSVSVYRHDVD